MTAPAALQQVARRARHAWAGPARGSRRDDRAGRPRGPGASRLPYALVLPSVAVLVLLLGYPLVRLVVLSVQEYGLRQQFGAPAGFVGLDNYRRILAEPQFWAVLARTVAFCAVTVALTMAVGMLVALLMGALGRALRTAVAVSLLLAWALPPLSTTIVWQWMFDTQYGVVNWLLTTVGAGDFRGHSWLSEPLSFFGVATIIVVWMGVPFVALTLYAGLTQVPADVVEAAELDGAGARQRFRHVIVPYLRPVLLILTALSVLWNFRVFTQIYVLQRAGGVARETNVLGVYAYRISIGENRFDVGSAVAVVMVAITLLLTAVYLRQMMRQEEL
jgi:N,N'-diacetylchitobiose transport system permease protein